MNVAVMSDFRFAGMLMSSQNQRSNSVALLSFFWYGVHVARLLLEKMN